MGTILTGAAVAIILGLAVYSIFKNHKSGKCCGGCDGCQGGCKKRG